MMEPTPAAPLEVIQAQLVLELLVVSLDPPAQLREADEGSDRDRLWQRRQPVFRRLGGSARPLDQQPFHRPGVGPLLVAMGRPHPEARKAGAHGPPRALTPRHGLPARRRPAARPPGA